MIERLYDRNDFLVRLRQEYLLTFLKIRQLTEDLSKAIRGTLAPKKVGVYPYYDHQIWEKGKRKRTYVKTKQVAELREKIELRESQERQLKELKSYLEELRKSLRHIRERAESSIEAYQRQRQTRGRQEAGKARDREAARQQPYGKNLK